MTIASAERNSIFMLRLRILVILTSLWIVGIVAATLIFSSLRGKLQYPQVLSHHTSEVYVYRKGVSLCDFFGKALQIYIAVLQ